MSGEKSSVKLYAVALKPKMRYVRSDGEKVLLTDVTFAITHSPTLLEAAKMKPSGVLDSIKVLKVKGKRAIEFPGSEELQVSELVGRYEYENPIPEWLGWIVGVVLAFIVISLLEGSGLSNYFPTWAVWLLVFFPIGEIWEHVFSDKTFYMSEIQIVGDRDRVVKFVKELRSNLGRNPILVLRDKDLKRLSDATGMDLISLENRWDEVIHGRL